MNNSDLTQQFVSLANQAAGLQGQGKLDAAVACYRQALALVPGHPVVLSKLGAMPCAGEASTPRP